MKRVSLIIVLFNVYVCCQWIYDTLIFGFYDCIVELISHIKQYGSTDVWKWRQSPHNKSKPGLDRFQILVDRILPPQFSASAHTVQTKDGYFVTVHRLHNANKVSPLKPILLQHALLECSVSYLIGGTDSIAVKLSEAGFDVWLGNNRGNEFSFTATEEYLFADWTFHEMGVYDLPAMIDHICKETRLSSLSYVGQSQGTAQFISLMHNRPEYQSVIDRAILLSPTIALNTNETVRAMTHLVDFAPIFFIKAALAILRIVPIPILATMGHRCTYTLGFRRCEMSFETSAILFEHVPSQSTSVANLKRWFRMLWRCGRLDTIYDLTKIRVPISVFVGREDNVVDVDKVIHICEKKLPNVEEMFIIPEMAHCDLTWSPSDIYVNTLIKLLSRR